jgi:hypothetical protein
MMMTRRRRRRKKSRLRSCPRNRSGVAIRIASNVSEN